MSTRSMVVENAGMSVPAHSGPDMTWKDLAMELEVNYTTPACGPYLSKWDKSLLTSRSILESALDYRLCKACNRPCLSSTMAYHLKHSCPDSDEQKTLKQIKEETNKKTTSTTQNKSKNKNQKDVLDEDDEDNDELDSTSRSKGNNNNNDTKSSSGTPSAPTRKKYKKRQAAELDDQQPGSSQKTPKKRSKTQKQKAGNAGATGTSGTSAAKSKNNGPVDVDKQCGVPLDNGQMCARSLTCKSHSMGAKRAVQGRSAPYDVLLASYQRKNQVKLASISTAQQLADENEALAGGLPIDPNVEVAQVLEGVKKVVPTPLERHTIMPVRMKNQFFRMREMFASTFMPKIGTAPTSGIQGRALAFDVAHSDQLHFLRPPAIRQQMIIRQQQLLRQQQLQRQQQQQQQQQQQKAPQQQVPRH